MKLRTSKVFAALVAVTLGLTGIVPTATSASAATPRCTAKKYYTAATGGCNANGTPGKDQLAVQCKGPRGYMVWRYGAWHYRYADWQEYVGCGASETAFSVSFNHS